MCRFWFHLNHPIDLRICFNALETIATMRDCGYCHALQYHDNTKGLCHKLKNSYALRTCIY